MGRMQAEGFAEAVADGRIDLDGALRWHLGANHYPPVSHMLEAAKAAIEAGNDDDFDREVDLPSGVTFRGTGESFAPARSIIESLHLEEFLT